MRKILIVDWDIHHGNGTQEIFYSDNRVLLISLHRQGRFYPFTDLGELDKKGEDNGKGFNVNLCWNRAGVRDVDYIFAWDHVVLPLAGEFEPDIILISAGFDAAEGDTLGDCKLSPRGFATLLEKICPPCHGLEGGYNLDSLSDCVSACVKVLLVDKDCIHSEMTDIPYNTTVQMVTKTREAFKPFWKVFRKDIPEDILSNCICIPSTSDQKFKEIGGDARSKGTVDAGKSAVQSNEKKKGFDWMFAKPVDEVKDHWVPDEVAKKCHSCAVDFSPFNRRQHCQNCGEILCDKCSQGRITLTAEDNAPLVRVCDRCMAEVTQRLSMAKEAASRSATVQSHEDLARKLKEKMERNCKSSGPASGTRMREVACPTCTVHLQVQVPHRAQRQWSAECVSTPSLSAPIDTLGHNAR